MSTRLDNLEIEEVSGVDSPANDLPGWMVLKNAGEAASAESQLAVLYAALGGATSLDGAPDEIGKARDLLSDTIEKLLTPQPDARPSLIDKMKALFGATEKGKMPPQFKPGYKKGDPEDATDDGADEDQEDASGKKVKKEETPPAPDPEDNDPVVKTSDFEVVKDAMSAVLDRLENIETELVGSASIPGQDDGVQKSAPTLRDGIISAAQGNRVVIT